MVKIYQQAFAHAGTKQVIPDSSDPQGFVSNEDGFTTDYELPDTDPNYKPIERSEFNGLMNTITEAVGEIQQFGFAKWQPITWPQGARVVEGGVVYRALTQTSQKPPHADWADDTDALKKYVDDSAIGVGQTWQDVTASRAANTTYTNTTGRSIMVFIQKSGLNYIANLTIGALTSEYSHADSVVGQTGVISTAIPPGATYSSSDFDMWWELR